MSTLREAAQQALEAAENRLPLIGQAAIIDELNALRTALAQQEQEPVLPPELEAHFRHLDAVLEQRPVGEVVCIDDNCENGPEAIVQLHNPVELGQLLYTHPPRREWASLTEEEIWKDERIMAENARCGLMMSDLSALARAIEQALKERNNG